MMGAKVAPSKSFNFPSHSTVKKWFDTTKWDHVEEIIDVVIDFRYLGAHQTTKHATNSATFDDRLTKAEMQFTRLRFCYAVG